jgi:hypothetical protein
MILARWKGPSSPPDADDIRTELEQNADRMSSGARIVCLGMIDVPEIEAHFFEPEIITPTRAIGRRLWLVAVAAALTIVWFLQLTGFVPFKIVWLSGFGYFVVMGLALGALWIWRAAFRPTYLRIAPGIIQVLTFQWSKPKPTIRSYPIDGHTLVVLHGPVVGKNRTPQSMTLLRGDRSVTIEFWQMGDSLDAVNRTWHAILSRAATPPLSEECLVG